MARNRMLNPEFWLDEELSTVSPQARLLYMGLWGICDDNYATFPDRPSWIRIQVFPYEEVDIPKLLAELQKIGKIIKFEADNSQWWYLKNFLKHQKVEKPSRPKYPKYTGVVVEYSPTSRSEVKRREVKRREENTGVRIARKAEEAGKFSALGAELIKEFEAVDPKNKRYYSNKTQRAAADFLIKEYGLEEVKKRVQVLPMTNKAQYFPRIYTPYDLQEKWQKLEDAVKAMRERKLPGNNFIL